MKGSPNGENPGDKLCTTCGLWYSNRGYIPHSRNCDRDEPVLDPGRYDVETSGPLRWEEVGGGHPSEGEGAKGAPQPEGEGVEDTHPPSEDGGAPSEDTHPSSDAPDPSPPEEPPPETPDPATDGGGEGLGLEGPPDPDPVDDDLEEDVDDGCPRCGGELEDIPAGKKMVLENGNPVLTDETDEWCPECEGIVEESGEVRI